MIEGGLARTDPPSPRASLPTWAEQGIRDGRDSKASQTARPGQTGLETLKPPHPDRGGQEAREALCGLPPVSSPISHHRLSGLHGNPEGSASPGEVGPTWARPPPSLLVATPLSRAPGAAPLRLFSPRPPEGCRTGGNFRGTWAKEKRALGSKRTFLEKGG